MSFAVVVSLLVSICVQDPGNRAYARAMDMIEKAPEIYQELQQQLQLQQASGRGGGEVRGVSAVSNPVTRNAGGSVKQQRRQCERQQVGDQRDMV